MFGHRSFLVLGGGAADILSLVKGGYEVANCNFTFNQPMDRKGKATSRVASGKMHIVLSQLPPQNIIDWALDPRKYKDGFIVMLDANNIPVEKILFQNAACTDFALDYMDKGDSYSMTKITILAEKIIVGNGISFDNEWTKD